jgi:hypothetical protein
MNMTYDTHVYLGPTLSLTEAKTLLPEVHYHPPIQCGDIIRVLRLKPKRLLIIDGIYETTPTVWHKEILLALEHGVEVFGASSMGALRAAELAPFGMIGIGKVFEDFLTHRLNDDDEVAVLHHDQNRDYAHINDAMVNIRATLDRAEEMQIISFTLKNKLIAQCKQQFYPYRSLKKAISEIECQYPECQRLQQWLSIHGPVDIKKQDAILALMHIKEKKISPIKPDHTILPITKFIASLIDDAELEPFSFFADWLPQQEQTLQNYHKEDTYFQLIKVLSVAIKCLISNRASNARKLDNDQLLRYIHHHQLFSPEQDLLALKNHEGLYPLICQLICQGHLKHATVIDYAPAAAFYFQLNYHELTPEHQQLIRMVVVCFCTAAIQLNDNRLILKQNAVANHFRTQRLWPKLNAYHKTHTTPPIDQLKLIEWVNLYMKVIYIHQGFRDIELGSPNTPHYFDWIHDSVQLYERVIDEKKK